MSRNNPSRYPSNQQAARSTRGQTNTNRQGDRQIPSPERMSVPVISRHTHPSDPSTSFVSPPMTGSTSSSMMSSFELAGSEYLEPTLAESTYARGGASSADIRGSNDRTGNTTPKPWGGFAQYMGMQGERNVAKETGTNARRAPVAAGNEHRGIVSRDSRATENDRYKNEQGDASFIESVEFEPTIRPSKYKSSFADRKNYKSFARSGNSNDRGGN
ncbi:predicted protein [Sclerotinia sclerotiorum 1980 UF-70]|uniref:Uncharacterized protein n=2 Tax=Sclerotinia sclerotiorum (strain ATCC 18683 / 1980 / Ss-1) TaxID=665079 RepID=A7ED83_SCLS1|nr:predicted protein [Sclerotinia sclerotiorum 1980 UF-70]APA11021.1 hypothetical protein sscle_07g057910 [Sclerotinia sclerotiorum 1980 UF-70]EDO00799.1 predicted protein [Sclerotinia sclerotiorum 1980 UF-70]